jgi:hypothetical protein
MNIEIDQRRTVRFPTEKDLYAVRMTSQYVVERRSFLSKQKFLFKINSNEGVIRLERCADSQTE